MQWDTEKSEEERRRKREREQDARNTRMLYSLRQEVHVPSYSILATVCSMLLPHPPAGGWAPAGTGCPETEGHTYQSQAH